MNTSVKSANPSGHLASRIARRQVRHLWVTFVGYLLFLPACLVAQYLIQMGWATPHFLDTILWCLLPYTVAAHLIYRAIHIPDAEQRTLLSISTLLPYFFLILGFALTHQRYSRGAVVLIAFLTTVWFWISSKLHQDREKLRIIFFDELTLSDLRKEMGEKSDLIDKQLELRMSQGKEEPASFIEFDGALISELHELDKIQNQLLAEMKKNHIRIYSVAAIAESLTGRKSLHEIRNPLWQPDSNPAYDTLKRLVDILVVLATSPAWIPLGALVAMIIKIDSRGPVFFQQTRTGLHGRPFRIWKFRTMAPTGDSHAQFAQTNDKRITRIGRFLRKSRLDEIPQLFNVLVGDMSLIGPRPEQHTFVNKFSTSIPSYPYRHLVRPGITGWAQVIQGYAASHEETEEKLRYDLYYVDHYSLALDILIVAKTIKTVLTGFGAR